MEIYAFTRENNFGHVFITVTPLCDAQGGNSHRSLKVHPSHTMSQFEEWRQFLRCNYYDYAIYVFKYAGKKWYGHCLRTHAAKEGCEPLNGASRVSINKIEAVN